MRMLPAVLATILLPSMLLAQAPTAAAPSQITANLAQALAGSWTGVLEYRDYSEPATSTKRVQLPTWLTITASSSGQSWHYIYDDGPTKTVEETDAVAFDPATSSYSEASNGKPPLLYKVTGYESLHDGRGQLILSGTGTDNNKPSETRVTLTIRRNLLEILDEVRPAGSAEPFAYRHRFTFTRAQPPQPTQSR